MGATFTSEMIDSDLLESGKPVRLQLLVAKPSSASPYPVVVFNHGSTGTARSPAMFHRSVKHEALASFFAARGWMTIFPQRRGRGKSEGQYGEGLNPNGVGYSCDAQTSINGANRALDDLSAIVRHVQVRHDVQHGRMLIGGASRGGVLAIAYAGQNPNVFAGVLNFNGGWLGQGCRGYEEVNRCVFRKGAAYPKPTLWLYGKRDNYYPIAHCRMNFESFAASGGNGSFHAVPGGHMLVLYPKLWEQALEEFLSRFGWT